MKKNCIFLFMALSLFASPLFAQQNGTVNQTAVPEGKVLSQTIPTSANFHQRSQRKSENAGLRQSRAWTRMTSIGLSTSPTKRDSISTSELPRTGTCSIGIWLASVNLIDSVVNQARLKFSAPNARYAFATPGSMTTSGAIVPLPSVDPCEMY